MISLKKLIESNQQEWVKAALSAYCAALEAMGNSGVRACPPLGTELQLGLSALQRQLSDNSTLSGVRETQQQVESELSQWGERSAEYYRGKTETIRALHKDMAGIGIIAISGAFGGQFLRSARSLGAHAVLSKPVEVEALLTTIADVLKQVNPTSSLQPLAPGTS